MKKGRCWLEITGEALVYILQELEFTRIIFYTLQNKEGCKKKFFLVARPLRGRGGS